MFSWPFPFLKIAILANFTERSIFLSRKMDNNPFLNKEDTKKLIQTYFA